jgi:hypothetical protein
LAGLAEVAAAAMFLVSVGSRYFVGEYSATVGQLPELLLAGLANACALGIVGISSMWPGRVGRVGVAMAVPVCLGAALAQFAVWLEVARERVDQSDLGPAYRIQNQAGLVAGLAGLVAVVALVRVSRRRCTPDVRARAAGFFGVLGVACYAISFRGDWYRSQASVGETGATGAGGARLPGVLTSDPAFMGTLVVMTGCALAVGFIAPRALAVGLAAGVLLGNVVIAAVGVGFFSGTFVAEGGVSPTLVYFWRVAALAFSVAAFVLILRVPPEVFGTRTEVAD